MKNIYGSTTTHKAAAFICGLCLLFILLTTSLQAVCYWIPDWWRNEYAKYDTPSNVRGEMSLDDAVHVTEDMLEYCIGRLDTLDDTEATIDGVTAPFFTDRERLISPTAGSCSSRESRRASSHAFCWPLSLYIFMCIAESKRPQSFLPKDI